MKFTLVVVAFLACGPRTKTNAFCYACETDPRGRELVLGVGDSIGIVLPHKWALQLTIPSDGMISLPGTGTIKAAGETPSGLRLAIEAALQRSGSDTGNAVTISVRSWRSYRISIEGEVAKPKELNPDHYVTVEAAIAMAGGLTSAADRKAITLLRTVGHGAPPRRIPIDYDAISSQERSDMNLYLLPGDIIRVPRR